MSAPFIAACIQPDCGVDPAANLSQVSALIEAAHGAGAKFIATPEVSNFRERSRAKMAAKAETEDGVSLSAYRTLAARLEVWLLIGSLAIRLDDDPRVANRSFLIGPDGAVMARYDKIHMFDVDLPNGERYRESESFRPGAEAVLTDLPWGRLGLTICYDVRFPQLYRALAQAGADFLSVPANFTQTTGAAHWHVLQRARAIENGCYVIAPAQCGVHPGKHPTYGHSVIVSPWGEVIADAGAEPGFVTANIDPAHVGRARQMIATLRQDRIYLPPQPPAGVLAAE